MVNLGRVLRPRLKPTRTMGGNNGSRRWGGKDAEPGRIFSSNPPRRKELSVDAEPVANTITIRGVLDADECQSIIAQAEEAGLELQTSRGPAYGEAVRHHHRAAFDDPAFAAGLWACGFDTALSHLRVGTRRPVGLNENIRIYKYVPGDVFGQHVDGSNMTSLGPTEFTLLIYLSGSEEGMNGGETAFYSGGKEILRVTPVAGSALIHRHGASCLLHESLPVSHGIKYILRSDIVFAE
eukprot:TRINITY_DN58801_c0_g1_i1.p1 TRINITY_DN58801_c0_g1~~TRINITY_DN58801_c0_g1_i1.p1  ORF type:complete len:238 (+),score=29.46 TRINITY_DN58801_c0_g1_i1:338-1051(+)